VALSIIHLGGQGDGQNGNYRFVPLAILEIPLFPERNCNRLRALAIVGLRDRIGVFFGNLGLNGGFKIGLCTQEVAGSIPVVSTPQAVSQQALVKRLLHWML
jgi:hypothetical protein